MLTYLFLSGVLAGAEPFLRMPDVHGNQVVFACEGDLWLGQIDSGRAVRITRHPGTESYPRFSPDGKTIAFAGQYDGLTEVYTLPVAGGAPKRLTYRSVGSLPLGWSADGSKVLFRSSSYPKNFGLFEVPADGGAERKLKVEFAAHGVYAPQGGKLAMTRFNRWSTAWFHYKGGMQNQIWVGEPNSGGYRAITQLPGTCEFPAWEGESIYFANENDGVFAVYGVPANGGAAKRMTEPSTFEIREVNSGPGAVVFEKGRGIELLDLKSGKSRSLAFRLDSDLMHTRTYTVPAATHAVRYSLSPTGKRVLVETRGQIVSLPVGEGEARLWKAVPGARLRRPMMSPDGKQVAYISDEGGEQQVWLANADGSGARAITNGKARQVTTIDWSPDSSKLTYYDSNWRLRLLDPKSGSDTELIHSGGAGAGNGWFGLTHSFSPDSRYLAYPISDGITDFNRIAIRNLETGEVKMLGTGFTDDYAPSFSKDGKYLAFLSKRNFSSSDDPILNQLNTAPMEVPCVYLLQADVENPFKLRDPEEPAGKKEGESAGAKSPRPIEFEGIEDRLVVVASASGSYSQIGVAGNRLILAGGAGITYYDLAAKSGGSVTTGGGFELSFDGTKLLVGDRVIDASSKDLPPTAGKLNFANLRLTIDPLKEWPQMFWDAWRLLRDYFYVANMNGVDWNAIGRKYSELLPSVRHRGELDFLIRWMQAELGSSHQYLQPGDDQSVAKLEQGAFLGIDVEPDAASGRLKITKILRGDGVLPSERSPILEPGFKVKEGDFLMAVAGQELTDRSNYLEALVGRAGQVVSVTVATDPKGSDRRTALLRPIGNENRLRQLEWVAANRRYIDQASGGKIGYVFLQAMGSGDVADFIRQYFVQRNKQALIVDTRFNNGGYVQTNINNILERKLSGHFNMRNRPTPWTRQGDYFAGPMACLINEFAVSCGEEFPHRFKGLGLGPLIGRRTYGGEIGSSPGWPLADGGVVSVPNYGMFTPDGQWVIEGPGVSPDIDVPSDPNAFLQGRDPQLDKAVEVLMAKIRQKPTTWPMPPADPQRIKRPPGGLG